MGPANMQFQSAPKDFEKKPNSNGKVTRSNLWFFFGDVGASQGFDALKISEFPTTLKSCPEVLGGSIVTFVDTKQVLFPLVESESRSKFYGSHGGEICESAPVGSDSSRVVGTGCWDDCQGAMGALMPWNRPGRPKGSFFGFGKWDPLF